MLLRSYLLIVALGCGAKQSAGPVANTANPPIESTQPAPTDPKEQHFQKMEEFADAICACKDTACVSGVQADIDTWNREHERPAMESADHDRAMELARRMVGCVGAFR